MRVIVPLVIIIIILNLKRKKIIHHFIKGILYLMLAIVILANEMNLSKYP